MNKENKRAEDNMHGTTGARFTPLHTDPRALILSSHCAAASQNTEPD